MLGKLYRRNKATFILIVVLISISLTFITAGLFIIVALIIYFSRGDSGENIFHLASAIMRRELKKINKPISLDKKNEIIKKAKDEIIKAKGQRITKKEEWKSLDWDVVLATQIKINEI